jgi:hypothetical protein
LAVKRFTFLLPPAREGSEILHFVVLIEADRRAQLQRLRRPFAPPLNSNDGRSSKFSPNKDPKIDLFRPRRSSIVARRCFAIT